MSPSGVGYAIACIAGGTAGTTHDGYSLRQDLDRVAVRGDHGVER